MRERRNGLVQQSSRPRRPRTGQCPYGAAGWMASRAFVEEAGFDDETKTFSVYTTVLVSITLLRITSSFVANIATMATVARTSWALMLTLTKTS